MATSTGRRLGGLNILSVPVCDIVAIWVKWRWQKNTELQEERKFVPNEDPDGFCFLRSAYRSLERFSRLMALEPGLSPSHTPLSVYWASSPNTVFLVTATEIETFMRELAVAVNDLDTVRDKDYITKWSSHSLRVGACVVLHSMGFGALDIQWILRWKSTAYMVYLRNTSILSARQNKALNRAAALPNYI